MQRTYTCLIEHSGGFGGGYGGTYCEEFTYTSEHRANSKANALDATTQWHRHRLKRGTAQVVPGTVHLEK